MRLSPLLAAVTLTVAPVRAQQPPIDARLKGFDAYMAQVLKDWNVPGIGIGIVVKDKLAFAKGYGYRDFGKKLPFTPTTTQPIASNTKLFTAVTAGLLVDEGKLDWDKPVRTWLPSFKLQDPAATLLTPRDLVCHRSGMPRHDMVWYNNPDLTRAQLVERLQYLEPSAQLREKFQYNNLMFLTAGYLVEQITGGTWEQAVQRRILEPTGMSHTLFTDADAQKTSDYAHPYREDHDKLSDIPFREVANMGPAGSITSSVNDMSRWLLLQLNHGKVGDKQLISPATLEQLHTPQMTLGVLPEEPEMSPAAYAMGWDVDAYRGHLRLEHGGGIDGFVSMVTLLPNDNLGIVVLTNAETPLAEILTLHAMDRLLKAGTRDWNAERLARHAKSKAADREGEKKKAGVRKSGTRPAHALTEYVGEYSHPGYGVLKIEKSGDHLRATYNHLVTELEHWHYEVWNGLKNEKDPVFEDMKYTFQTDLNGTVTSLSVPFEPRVKEAVFIRRPDAKLSDPTWLKLLVGEYELGGDIFAISLAGERLWLNLKGQPPYELEPSFEGWFNLKSLTGFRIRFNADAKGRITELVSSQPNGVFTAKRKE